MVFWLINRGELLPLLLPSFTFWSPNFEKYFFLNLSKSSMLGLRVALREMCPNTEFFLVCIFLHLTWIRGDTEYLRIQSEFGKIRTRKNSISGYFSRSVAVFCGKFTSFKAQNEFHYRGSSSHQRCSINRRLKNSPQACNLLKETLAQVFSCEFCKNFTNTFLQNTGWLVLSIITVWQGSKYFSSPCKKNLVNGYFSWGEFQDNSYGVSCEFLVSYMQGKSMFNHNNKEIMTISQRAHLITVLNKKRN